MRANTMLCQSVKELTENVDEEFWDDSKYDVVSNPEHNSILSL
jgi:hypothetical protein